MGLMSSRNGRGHAAPGVRPVIATAVPPTGKVAGRVSSWSPTVVVGSEFWLVNPSVKNMCQFFWHDSTIGSVEPGSDGLVPFR